MAPRAEQDVLTARLLLKQLTFGSFVQKKKVKIMWVHLTRVHQLPELVDQSLVTQRRVRCLGEGWILTEHAQDLMSDWTETVEFSPENVPTHPKHANFASRNASFFRP